MPSKLVQLLSYLRIAALLLAAVVILASWAYPPGRSHLLHQTSYTDTIRIAVSGGWNLISIPLAVPDGRKNVLFPHAISDAYGYERGYVQVETLQFGKGYWLKFAAADTITVIGAANFFPIVEVAPGWNIVGSSAVRTSLSEIVSEPATLLNSKLFGYNTAIGYSESDTIEPGKGYWVKCSAAGTFSLVSAASQGPTLLSPANGSPDRPTSLSLRWNALPFASAYHLQVATDSSFTQSMVLNDSLSADTTRRLCLGYGTTCYWRVAEAYEGDLRSAWSPVWHFTTAVPAESLRWEFLGFPNEGKTNVSCIAVNPENDSIVYVGTGSDFSAGQQGRVYRTTDLGASWDTLVQGVTPMVIRINPHYPDIVYVGLIWADYTPPGIIKTIDGGATWSWSHSGIYVDWETGISDIEIDPQYPDTMFATLGSISGMGGMYKTTNGGHHWFVPTTNDTLAGWDIGCIAIRPDTTSIMYAATMQVGFLFRSSDGGYSWTRTGMWSETTTVGPIAIDPREPQIMYAATDSKGGLLLKSTDGGWTWFTSSQGLLPPGGFGLAIRNCTEEVFMVSYYSPYVFESMNLGVTWLPITSLPNSNPISAAVLSADGTYLYIAVDNSGIFRARLISGNQN